MRAIFPLFRAARFSARSFETSEFVGGLCFERTRMLGSTE